MKKDFNLFRRDSRYTIVVHHNRGSPLSSFTMINNIVVRSLESTNRFFHPDNFIQHRFDESMYSTKDGRLGIDMDNLQLRKEDWLHILSVGILLFSKQITMFEFKKQVLVTMKRYKSGYIEISFSERNYLYLKTYVSKN